MPGKVSFSEASTDYGISVALGGNVNGDAYVDHASWGVAAIGRWLEAHGYRVGIIAQPDWDDVEVGEREVEGE